MKKIISLFMLFVTVTVAWAYDFSENGVYYSITKSATTSTPGAVSVTSGDGYSGVITIPAQVANDGKTYNVTAIANQAFENSIHLTEVSIGSNVTSIGYRAFYGCDELEEIDIPDNVTSLSISYGTSETFVGCSQLRKATLGAGITNMGSNVFKDCKNLTNVTINLFLWLYKT